ncbi:hypothetical protein QLT00_gp76 [Gordonia phage Commandaria]|uniref:Uncharacterized protein n=1 Tax=Gordonia phage Commandaria TaxID=3038364 RepID=A0AAF0K1Y5_9CAUD|nr:hypothetical protein QLT00_gp76 [Gordonia phage Commandaria]WGH20859.1 hypothetical protein [Gordonia phage Commandaria]
MATKTKKADRDRMADELNFMDGRKNGETIELAPANFSEDGWIARREPSGSLCAAVQIYACEIMARDIGRYIRFPVRFGDDKMSAKIVLAELRQISIDGAEVHLNVGAGAAEEYSFNHYDLIGIYGREMTLNDILDTGDRLLDDQNNGTGSTVER